MLDLLIVADDLTGAIDTGVQFVNNGYKTLVTTEPLALPDCIDPSLRVLVVTTTSRHLTPDKAFMRVYNAVAAARSWGVGLFYKKTDSALRGNIGAELAAMMQASSYRRLVFAPALPKFKRTVQNGTVYIGSLPLRQSDIGRDPFSPVVSDYVPQIIGEQTDIPVHVCNRDNFLLADGEESILLLDAQSDEELRDIARQIRESGKRVALAGCAGFAAALPILLPPPEQLPICRPPRAERQLFVCGSISQISMSQVKMAEAAGVPVIRLRPEQYLWPAFSCSDGFAQLCEELEDRIRVAGCTVLYTAKDSLQAAEAMEYARRIHLETEGLHITIADCVGKVVASLLQFVPVQALTVFGGDTLQGILRHAGCSDVYPEKELFPGVVQSRTAMYGAEMIVISKSGGFGSVDTILRVQQAFGNAMEGRRLENE